MKPATVVLVSGILKNTKNEILLLQRSNKNSSYHHYWQLPEGKVEFGESPEAALKREVKEETSLRTLSSQLIGTHATTMHVRGTLYHVIRIIYQTTWSGNISLTPEHIQFRWLNTKQARRQLRLLKGLSDVLASIPNQ